LIFQELHVGTANHIEHFLRLSVTGQRAKQQQATKIFILAKNRENVFGYSGQEFLEVSFILQAFKKLIRVQAMLNGFQDRFIQRSLALEMAVHSRFSNTTGSSQLLDGYLIVTIAAKQFSRFFDYLRLAFGSFQM